MCGRFSLISSADSLRKRFNVKIDDIRPRYNIAPGQLIPAILMEQPDEIRMVKWGFAPKWAPGMQLINAKAETVDEKPAFRESFRKMRCLIPADGFYEWRKTKPKVAFRFTMKDSSLFAFAGIYSKSGNDFKCAIITTAPNDLMKPIHNRMPAILEQKDEKKWMSDSGQLQDLLKPYPAEKMNAYPISDLVNSVRNDGADIIRSVKSLAEY